MIELKRTSPWNTSFNDLTVVSQERVEREGYDLSKLIPFETGDGETVFPIEQFVIKDDSIVGSHRGVIALYNQLVKQHVENKSLPDIMAAQMLFMHLERYDDASRADVICQDPSAYGDVARELEQELSRFCSSSF